jgi:hypothetical protein
VTKGAGFTGTCLDAVPVSPLYSPNARLLLKPSNLPLFPGSTQQWLSQVLQLVAFPKVSCVLPSDMLDIVVLSPRHLSLDQNRGAQRVKDRAKERALNESLTTNATTKTIKGGSMGRRRAATTSTKPPANLGYIFAGPPGPLPSVYGTILSGRR